jgi:hypothetical protein
MARVALGAAALVTLGAALTGGPYSEELRGSLLAGSFAVLLFLVTRDRRDRRD